MKIGDDEPVWSSSGSTTAVAAVALFGNGVESSISGEVEQVDDDNDDDGALRRFGERGSSPSSSPSTPTRTMGLGRFEERLFVERGDNGMRSRESEPERRGFEADAGSTRGDGAHLCAVVFAAGTCEKEGSIEFRSRRPRTKTEKERKTDCATHSRSRRILEHELGAPTRGDALNGRLLSIIVLQIADSTFRFVAIGAGIGSDAN